MKLFIIHILSILFFFGMGAGKAMSEPPGVYEEKAIEILNKTGDVLKSHDAIYLEFIYMSPSSGIDFIDEATGHIYIYGDKYYIKSGDIYFISDGEYAWTYLEDVNELHISYLEDTEGLISPLSLLEDFEKQFRPLWLREEISDDGETLDIIDMVPTGHDPFLKYRVAISKKSRHIAYMVAYDAHGTTYTYKIISTLINPEIPAGMFSFDPNEYPGIEVIDLR